MSLRALPTIEEKIEKQLRSINAELDTIPRPPTQGVTGIVRDLLKGFTGTVRKEMRSKVGPDNWRNIWDRLRTDLDKELQSLSPRLHVPGALDRDSFHNEGPEMIDLCSDDEGSIQAPALLATPQKRKREQSSAVSTPSKNPRVRATDDGTPTT